VFFRTRELPCDWVGLHGLSAQGKQLQLASLRRPAAAVDRSTTSGGSAAFLNAYAAHLETLGYAYKTLLNELTTLNQAIKRMIQAGHLQGVKPLDGKLRKAESERAYCYRSEEVRAMIESCREKTNLQWLGDIITALACTGLRTRRSNRTAPLLLAHDRLGADQLGRLVVHGVQARGELQLVHRSLRVQQA
jgi:hypothetical protein